MLSAAAGEQGRPVLETEAGNHLKEPFRRALDGGGGDGVHRFPRNDVEDPVVGPSKVELAFKWFLRTLLEIVHLNWVEMSPHVNDVGHGRSLCCFLTEITRPNGQEVMLRACAVPAPLVKHLGFVCGAC